MNGDDYPDEEWIEDHADEEDDLLTCPSCRNLVHEDTQKCPCCGDWIVPVYHRGRSRQWVWAMVAVLLILSLLLWTVR